MSGKLIVISGLSGAGKGTVAAELVNRYDDYVLSISATTRDKRANEIDGVHYFFVTKEEFLKMISNNELLEYAQYVDNYYGTPKNYVLDRLNEGKNVILEIEMQGALKVKKIFDKAVLIFLLTRDAKTQYNRLCGRKRENESQIKDRMMQAITDAGYAKEYDYILINDNVEDTISDVRKIVDETFDNNNATNLKMLDNLVNDIKEGNYV